MSKNRGAKNSGLFFINVAKERGAEVSDHKKGGYTEIKVSGKGKTFIKKTKDPLDPQTVSTVKKIFRLLGLMMLGFGSLVLLVDAILSSHLPVIGG